MLGSSVRVDMCQVISFMGAHICSIAARIPPTLNIHRHILGEWRNSDVTSWFHVNIAALHFRRVYIRQRQRTALYLAVRACLYIGGRRGWRPRSSWKLLSSHPACRAIQALKGPSELLKRAEEGWEFLSQWKLLEDINFYYHFVFSTVYSHEPVCARFTWVVRVLLCVPRVGDIKGMLLFLLFADLLEVFLADTCENGVDPWEAGTG